MTATSRRALLVAIAIAALAVAGCGGSGGGTSSTSAARPSAAGGPFAVLDQAGAPSGWLIARTPLGATLAYPPSWRALGGDRGTVSAALRDGRGRYLGYLNVTPRQGEERQSSWGTFRAAHNRGEGDRDVRVLASARGLRLSSGTAACVKDAYTTSVGTHYVEIACLTAGAHPVVVVGAAPPDQWRAQSPVIARAISAVRS